MIGEGSQWHDTRYICELGNGRDMVRAEVDCVIRLWIQEGVEL